jgi:non-ribosomal peptide synthetase component F
MSDPALNADVGLAPCHVAKVLEADLRDRRSARQALEQCDPVLRRAFVWERAGTEKHGKKLKCVYPTSINLPRQNWYRET